MSFTGKSVQVQDQLPVQIEIQLEDGTKEIYTYTRPKIVVGNLVIGERYIEP